ncbi:hypothetical protein RND71_018907 [Anisodus tanguticus]|uniref:Uncharacterized protein n=1 Tax=Anisodus tanguticus TaxID=243964 RepID=A0AAE1S731_9SOLA|nr:hypothetical protein RND71_018907 [Anisodus tanguticus]
MRLLPFFLALLIMASMLEAKPLIGFNNCPVRRSRCAKACIKRCALKGHKKRCLFYCNHCCNWCQCVPPGYVGQNKGCCACYNNWHTQSGGPKCP